MADEFNSSTNWWDSSNSSRNRFESGSNNNNNNNPSSNPSSSSGLSNTLGSFSWPTAELMVDHVKPRSSLDQQSSNSNSVSDSGPADLHLMGLGRSSQAIDYWNQSLYRGGEKSDGSNFRLIENYQQQESGGDMHNNIGPSSSSPSSQVHQWRERVLGFSLDHQQFSPHGSSTDSTVTCQGLQSSSNFQQMDNISPSIYACGSPATLLQGLVLAAGSPSDQHNQTQQAYNPYGQNYDQFLPPSSSSSWSKVPNKQTHQLPHSHLHFSNNAPFWNASASSNINDVRPSYFQPLQAQFPASSFDEKPKNISDVRDSNTVVKKSGGEGGGGGAAASTAKRPRNETPSTLPAFKVRKEKMGDRITALQQLVSPFGKTDTASVLSEAIEYIKFLHEQVSVLSTPYMKSGAAIHHQHHQNSDHKSKDGEGQKQDLRSRGLCLVPVSSTFPVTHETTMDIWTPTYGGTFR